MASETNRVAFTATYTLIYDFLKKQSLTKTADALKKEAKSTVVLKDGSKDGGPGLHEMLKQYKELKKRCVYCNTSSPQSCSHASICYG